MTRLRSSLPSLAGKVFGRYTVSSADEFTYLDPVDQSVSHNQGIRILFTDGSRIIFRLSGTAGSGATIRLYLERYEGNPDLLGLVTAEAMQDLVPIALEVSDLINLTGMKVPTVIT